MQSAHYASLADITSLVQSEALNVVFVILSGEYQPHPMRKTKAGEVEAKPNDRRRSVFMSYATGLHLPARPQPVRFVLLLFRGRNHFVLLANSALKMLDNPHAYRCVFSYEELPPRIREELMKVDALPVFAL
jgi:hypothetical protein